jgi:hypothetical protein
MEEGHSMSDTKASNVTPVAPTKKRRTRTASAPKPAFVILQILGDDGQPSQIDKRRVKIVAVERSAEKVMEAMEEGAHTNAFYLRFIVPAGPRQPQRQKQEAQAA